ncbi:ABC transporter permease [Rhodobacter sp.]
MLTLILVSVIVFAIGELLPGDAAEVMLGQSATPESLAALRAQMGLDRPAVVRYFLWVAGLLQGDLGLSMASNMPIAALLTERLGNTLLLAGLTAVVVVPLSLALGILSAMKPGSFVDRLVTMVTMLVVSVPEFLLATTLIIFLAVKTGLFPAISNIRPGDDFVTTLQSLALPVATLTFFVGAQMIRMTRATLLNVLNLPFVEMAILKGVPRRRIVLRHALPNAVGPITNVIALALAYLVSGVVVVETIFAFPGMAKLMVESVQVRDLALVQVCAMLVCTAYVVLMTLADTIQVLSNPRLRTTK